MASYNLETYHIEINNEGDIRVLLRSNNEGVASYSLNEQNIRIKKDGSDFYMVGTTDMEDIPVATTELEDNEVDINLSFELINIGEDERINLSENNALVVLDESTLNFYEEDF